MDKKRVSTSKFLSLILRHRPEAIGVSLDREGWLDIDELIEQAGKHGKPLTRDLIEDIVATNDKKRFALSDDRKRIRASQGHSLRDVQLDLEPKVPPAVLFHGTVEEFLSRISRQGLLKRRRNHVHLSADRATADKVGARRGKPVILEVDASSMHAPGHAFFLAANGVWLTDAVPAEFLTFPDGP